MLSFSLYTWQTKRKTHLANHYMYLLQRSKNMMARQSERFFELDLMKSLFVDVELKALNKSVRHSFLFCLDAQELWLCTFLTRPPEGSVYVNRTILWNLFPCQYVKHYRTENTNKSKSHSHTSYHLTYCFVKFVSLKTKLVFYLNKPAMWRRNERNYIFTHNPSHINIKMFPLYINNHRKSSFPLADIYSRGKSNENKSIESIMMIS